MSKRKQFSPEYKHELAALLARPSHAEGMKPDYGVLRTWLSHANS